MYLKLKGKGFFSTLAEKDSFNTIPSREYHSPRGGFQKGVSTENRNS